MARREEGEYPWWIFDRRTTKPGSLFRENPKGGESFARGLRWLGRHSPLRGCSGLAALAPAKILRRRTPRNFQTGSKLRQLSVIYRPCAVEGFDRHAGRVRHRFVPRRRRIRPRKRHFGESQL